MTRGYRSLLQDLINVWTMPATMLKNKVMYRQFIQSVDFVNEKCYTQLRPLYLNFSDMPRIRLYCTNQNTVGLQEKVSWNSKRLSLFSTFFSEQFSDISSNKNLLPPCTLQYQRRRACCKYISCRLETTLRQRDNSFPSLQFFSNPSYVST
jgi:hypothetical protein